MTAHILIHCNPGTDAIGSVIDWFLDQGRRLCHVAAHNPELDTIIALGSLWGGSYEGLKVDDLLEAIERAPWADDERCTVQLFVKEDCDPTFDVWMFKKRRLRNDGHGRMVALDEPQWNLEPLEPA